MEDGFPSGLGVDGDEESNLRVALEHYHLAPGDIDCMIGQVRDAGRFTVGPGSTAAPDAQGRPTVELTAEELDCAVPRDAQSRATSPSSAA